ncbi:ubiquilin-1-like [Betta splendens]|uniref:Ubiquilin-1-like n=1 Tax=Betta splendens TaxID=158456 RepID=A0A8M1HIB7_BETSP|nr:ubiquilin-1-like [Betta splendens]
MSGPVREEPGPPGRRRGSDTIRVAAKSPTDRRDFDVRGDCTVRQLKCGLSERLGVPAEQLVLIHSGRVLGESEVLSHLEAPDGTVSVCVIRSGSASETTPSALTHDAAAASPTSPLCLVDGLESLTSSGSGLFAALQRQMERQLLADPEMMRSVLGGRLAQSTLSSASPQLTRLLILSNPQIQHLLETNPVFGDMLNNTDVITQVLELIRNPDMIEEVLHNKNGALDDSQPVQDNNKPPTHDWEGLVKTEEDVQEHSFSRHHRDPLSELISTPRAEANPQPPAAGMQSLLEEVMASPGLMESLLSGPYVSSLLNCLSQNPDLAAQMLLSHPLISGNPPLQQQMRQHLPLFLQQMQNPELLSALLNPKTMEAVLQIQQGLQTLAAEAPGLIPMTGLTNTGTSVTTAPPLSSDSVPNSQSGDGPHVATVTEQQQKFVHQMLKALAATSDGVHSEEAGLHEELQQMSSVGFEDRDANLQALISSEGDLTTAVQRLLGL